MPRRVAVVVLGDLGHSPRMQYHCLSLTKNGFFVDFVGYRGSSPLKSLSENRQVTLHYLTESPYLPSFFGLILKLFWQLVNLMWCLVFGLSKTPPDIILLQNPPGLPALFTCWLAAKIFSLRGNKCRFIIDWHNYTHSIFALRYGARNAFVKLVEKYEFFMGKLADGGLCVTNAMKDDLKTKNIRVTTHFDRPASAFRPLNDDERVEFLNDLSKALPAFKLVLPNQNKNHPVAMLISSTSWTLDENFDLLLLSLKMYDEERQKSDRLPNLLVTVTGKGPLKQHYVQKAKDHNFKYVTLVTPWFTAEEYPKMLGCADVGVSLHYSSSGFDLPMKCVDMQGCGLPILSVRFKCVDELIEDGSDGFLFDTESNLTDLLCLLLMDFPRNDLLNVLKARCRTERRRRKPDWDAAWDEVVFPYFTGILTSDDND